MITDQKWPRKTHLFDTIYPSEHNETEKKSEFSCQYAIGYSIFDIIGSHFIVPVAYNEKGKKAIWTLILKAFIGSMLRVAF